MAVIIKLLGGIRATVFLALFLLCTPLAFLGGCSKGASKWEGKFEAEVAAHKITRQGHAAVLADLAAKTKAVAKAVKTASDKYQTEREANDLAHKQETARAKTNRSAIDRALRNGTLLLQDHWAGYQPFGAPGAAFTAAGGPDGYAELRFQGAAEDVQAGDEADAWIRWLQRELIATRAAMVRAGYATEVAP